jgi:tRNA threonylcarbamoyladenosine biosynthesis protein TsaB
MILALDTATQSMSVALANRLAVLAEHTWFAGLTTTQQLAPAVQQLFASVGIQAQQLQAVAVALGPGGFSSLRAGLAFAKGLCLAHNLPLIGIPTLDILTVAHPQAPATLIAILQAGRGRIAAQRYHWQSLGWKVSERGRIYTWQELVSELDGQPTIVCGEIDDVGHRLLNRKVRIADPIYNLRQAGWLAQLAWQQLDQRKTHSAIELQPIYWQTPPAPVV